MSRPNVLLLMGDEHPVFMTGCYGHRSVKTPTLDALAGSGATFDAAYCASPLCAPSRAAMLSSRHIHTLETWDNASPFRSDWPTFAHSFRAAGYRTALCGKMHFVGPDQLHGFQDRWTQDIYPADFGWTRLSRGGTVYNSGQNINRVLEAAPGWTSDMDYDEEVIFRALYGLRQLAKQPQDPFFLCVSFSSPHYPFRAPQRYWDMYSDDDIDLPVLPDDYQAGEHEYVKWIRKMGAFDQLVPPEVCRNARRAVLARLTMLDEYLGRIVALLTELGMERDTLIAYTSDHGDMMGEHGLWFKCCAYEWCARVPLIFSGPGVPTHRVAEPTSLLDLGPTLCNLASVPMAYPVCDGRDLGDLVRRQRPSGQGLAIMEAYTECMGRGVRTVWRGNHKLTVAGGTEPELFDLAKDSGEWHNVAADPAYADVRKELLAIAHQDWDPQRLDEQRWQSEERRLAIVNSLRGESPGWQMRSPPPEQPLGIR